MMTGRCGAMPRTSRRTASPEMPGRVRSSSIASTRGSPRRRISSACSPVSTASTSKPCWCRPVRASARRLGSSSTTSTSLVAAPGGGGRHQQRRLARACPPGRRRGRPGPPGPEPVTSQPPWRPHDVLHDGEAEPRPVGQRLHRARRGGARRDQQLERDGVHGLARAPGLLGRPPLLDQARHHRERAAGAEALAQPPGRGRRAPAAASRESPSSSGRSGASRSASETDGSSALRSSS